MSDVSFFYRLPVTFVRVTGTRSQSLDIDGARTTECKATVTTEVGADFRTRCPVSLSAESLATQKTTWNLTSDGRLTGADVSTTVEPLADWGAAIQAGATVAGIAGPALLAAGPPGWVALAGAVGVAAVGTRLLVHENLIPDFQEHAVVPGLPDDASPATWGVHARYVETHEGDAKELANLRSCLAEAGHEHARAVRAATMAEEPEEQRYWANRVEHLRRMLSSASVGAARAESSYAAWVVSQLTISIENHDFRFPVDLLPSRSDLETWVADAGQRTYPIWAEMLSELSVAVSVDLEHLEGDNGIERNLTLTPTTSSEKVHYRSPRPAVVMVWDVTKGSDSNARYSLKLRETQRIPIAYPGNETTINIETGHDSTNAVAVSFDESGAMTKVTTEIKDPSLQRASAVSSLLTKVSDSVTAGKDLREAVSPPSLVDRAAEAKAAAELGLVPAAEDPLKQLKAQLAEQQLRAQLKLAEQMQNATSIPVFVSVSSSE
jgi:hypothetical protein